MYVAPANGSKHAIPFSCSVFIKIHFLLRDVAAFWLRFQLGFYVIPVVAFVFYVLASLELIAEEIEDRFWWRSERRADGTHCTVFRNHIGNSCESAKNIRGKKRPQRTGVRFCRYFDQVHQL